MASYINRITLFKVADPALQQQLLDAYTVLAKTQSKDGKPYIRYLKASAAHNDPRAQGFTVLANTQFDSLEDMKFYDEECAAHAKLKQVAVTLGMKDKPLTIYSTVKGKPCE